MGKVWEHVLWEARTMMGRGGMFGPGLLCFPRFWSGSSQPLKGSQSTPHILWDDIVCLPEKLGLVPGMWDLGLVKYTYIKQKSQLNEDGAAVSWTIAESTRKKKVSSSFLGRTQTMKTHGLFVYWSSPNFRSLPVESFLLPLPCEALHVDGCGCRPLILQFSAWAPINPSLLEKYLAVCWCQAAYSAQLGLTLVIPWTSLPGSSVHGVFQTRILEWVAIPSSRGSCRPRDWMHVSCTSCIGRRVLHH